MKLIKESAVLGFLCSIYALLSEAVCGCLPVRLAASVIGVASGSAVYSFALKLMEAISSIFKGSFIYRILYTKGKSAVYSEGSMLLKLADKIIGGAFGIFAKLVAGFAKLNRSSLNKKIYDSTLKAAGFDLCRLIGAVLVLTVLVPGKLWNNAYGLAVAVVLVFIYLVSASFKENGLKVGVSGIPVSMLLFMITCFYAVVISVKPEDSLRVLMFFITSFAFMLVIAGAVNTEDKLDMFSGFMYWALMATAVICVVQGIVGVEQDALLVDAATSGNLARAFSTFENPNNYAEFIVLFIPFAAAFALNREKKKDRLVLILMLAIPLLALVLTYSRSCWVSFMIAAVVFVLLYDYKLFPYFIILCIFAVPFLPESVWTRILSIGSMQDSSNFYRVQIWQGTSRMFNEWALTGTGLGPIAFTEIYRSYAIPEAMSAPHSHMLFLEILLEAGIVSFAALVIWWLGTLKSGITSLIRETLKGRKIRNIIIASLSALSGIIFVSLVEYVWFYPRVMMMFFVVAGVTLASVNILRRG